MPVGTLSNAGRPIFPLLIPPTPPRPLKPVKATKPSAISVAMQRKRPR